MRHRQLQEPEVLAADDADARRRDEMSDEEEEEELDEEVSVTAVLFLLITSTTTLCFTRFHYHAWLELKMNSQFRPFRLVA